MYYKYHSLIILNLVLVNIVHIKISSVYRPPASSPAACTSSICLLCTSLENMEAGSTNCSAASGMFSPQLMRQDMMDLPSPICTSAPLLIQSLQDMHPLSHMTTSATKQSLSKQTWHSNSPPTFLASSTALILFFSCLAWYF